MNGLDYSKNTSRLKQYRKKTISCHFAVSVTNLSLIILFDTAKLSRGRNGGGKAFQEEFA